MASEASVNLGAEELASTEALKASAAEFLATMFYVFVGVGSICSFILTGGAGGIVPIAVAHGLAIALLVAAVGPISGGHVNPAVTFAAVITNRISVVRGAMYWAAQVAGAIVGALLLKLFLNDQLIDAVPGIGGHGIDKQAVGGTVAAFGMEAFLTALLVFTVFGTALQPKANPIIAPLVIGFAMLVIHLVAIPLTGAGVNPARTLGPAIAFWRFDDIWVYIVGPLLGGAIAGLVYYVLYLMEDEQQAARPCG